MNRRLPSLETRLFRGETGVVMPSLVQELVGTIRLGTPNQRWNRFMRESAVKDAATATAGASIRKPNSTGGQRDRDPG